MLIKAGKLTGKASPNFVDARGSNCGGANETKGRTFDLSGVSTSEIVYVQGSFLHYPDYSKSTVGGVSRITFTDKIYDQFYIKIYYWER